MPRLPRRVAAVAAALVVPTGCLTLYSKTEVVRAEEPRRPVRFETPEAAASFQTSLNKQTGKVGSTYLGVPFVTLYSASKELSESARWNEAVACCDADQDGVITAPETAAFALRVKE